MGESSPPPPQSWTEFGDSLFLPLVIMSTMRPGTRNEHYNARAHTHIGRGCLVCCAHGVHYYSKSFSLSPVCFNSLRKRREQRRGLPPPFFPPFLSPPSGYAGEGGREGKGEPLGVEEERVGGDMTSRLMGFVWAFAAKWVGERGGGVNYHHHLLLHHHTFSSSLATRRKLDLFPGTDGALFK